MSKSIKNIIVLVVLCLIGGSIYYFINREDEVEEDITVNVESSDDGLIHISGGTYTMGSDESENWRDDDETQHTVTVSDFYVDPYEVTQEDYEAIMGENPSAHQGDNLPVENVTYYDALEYCNRLSEANGLEPVYTIDGDTVTWDRSANGYRLLTEAEWEYVARANTDTIYYYGNQITSDEVNFQGSYPYNIETNYVTKTDDSVVTSSNRGETIAVDGLSPNAFGLYNIYGNVAEWVFDYYGEYDTNDTMDPSGASTGTYRVNRGGSYNDFAKHVRSAYRSATNPIDYDENLGFRICRNDTGSDTIVETTYIHHETEASEPRILVAYFSYTGNTEDAARIIAEITGGDLVEITMAEPYTGNIYESTATALDDYIIPELTTEVNMDDYDIVLLGYPTWWATLPMPVVSFIESYDFTDKTVINFSSHGGTIFGESISALSKLLPDSYVGIGYEFEYSSSDEEDIREWLELNNVPQV